MAGDQTAVFHQTICINHLKEIFVAALEISLNLRRQKIAVDILEFGGNSTVIFSLGFIVRGILKHMS